MATISSSTPYSLEDPFKTSEYRSEGTSVSKAPVSILDSTGVSAPAKVDSASKPEKQNIFKRMGSIFNAKPNEKSGTDMENLDNATANLGENSVKDTYAAAGLELSGSKKTVGKEALVAKMDNSTEVTQEFSQKLSGSGNVKRGEVTPEESKKLDEQFGTKKVAQGETSVKDIEVPATNEIATVEQVDASAVKTTQAPIANNTEEKTDKPKNEEGSLGDLQAKKQEIVDAQKDTAKKQLSEKSEKYQKLDEKSAKIDSKLEELNKNPEANKEAIAELEGKKAKIGDAQSKMVDNRAEKLAGNDENYKKLSVAEAKEQKVADKFKDFDVKDKDGNKISQEELKGKKLSDFVDKEGNVDRTKLEKESGLKATYSQAAIKNDPQKILDDPNASPEETKKAEKVQMMQFMQAMMGGGNATGASNAKSQPAQPSWQQQITQSMFSITAFNEQRKQDKKFGSLTTWGY